MTATLPSSSDAPECDSAVIPRRNTARNSSALPLVAAFLIFAVGVLLRIYPSAGFTGIGFDEVLYRTYIVMLDEVGIANYPSICENYLSDQRRAENMAKLPPTRFVYIFSGWLGKRISFGDAPPVGLKEPKAAERDPALVSLHRVSCLASIGMLALSGLAAWRMFGTAVGLGVLALVATSPTQIHFSQHALIDGFFAMWATLSLWLLWENLQRPAHAIWLTAYGFSLMIMVMAKENAFFVYVALMSLIAANRWLKLGTVTPRLLLVSVLGPLAGVALLILLAGGAAEFAAIYVLLVTKAQNLPYAIMTGDGPWYRYLVELMTVSPIVFALALTGLFTLSRDRPPYACLLTFVVVSFAFMCNVRYGMNLRYTSIWALPIAAFAAAQLLSIARRAGRHYVLVAVALFAGVCATELRQYETLFHDHAIYELAPEGLLRAIKMIKDDPSPPPARPS